MLITTENIKKLIVALGFIPTDGETDVFHKKYSQHNGYTLRVNFANKTIEYTDTSFEDTARITVDTRSTSNFAKQENFVVLECVDRLLEKGYSPNSIVLEKVYPSGRGHSGELDILINDAGGQAFLMIECKTFGAEHTKEHNKMLKDGGQLFTYYQFDTETKYLCLYSSALLDEKVVSKNDIIPVSGEWKTLSNTKERHNYWNKTFKDNGIFEDYAHPYNIVHKALTYDMLKDLKEGDDGIIYNGLMEILRHNAISDKPNAFNKLLNLFICKIKDEVENSDNTNELSFQWREDDNDIELQMRLNDLYKDGMYDFVNIEVDDYTKDDFDKALQISGANIASDNSMINKIFTTLRLKKSPNFAFKEIENDAFFKDNARVVREMVELLQGYKFRYGQKHAFLGELFERILNDSMKQESGQFFTPAPIARFIISSLPLDKFVQDRLDSRHPQPIPAVIDYAVGSGHFLTEYMSKMQNVIEKAKTDKANPKVKLNFELWSGLTKFLWAKDYVYGIDSDYRLVKTAKVSAFFNGDGEARIICANGLGNFKKTNEYIGKLKHTDEFEPKNNGQFDILISNPPYSVKAFKCMLRHGKESFELYDGLTDSSSEIECLFIERMKQLLKVGGFAGVILPSSMLTNGGIYSRARGIIFKYFNVKAIVELGSGTFMETGTNTVILFLERRLDSDHENIAQAINTFFINKHDVTVAGIERAFSTYVANVYGDLNYEDYMSFVNKNPSDAMKAHELWLDCEREYGGSIYLSIIRREEKKIEEFLVDCLKNNDDASKLTPADFTAAKMKVRMFFADYKDFSVHGFDNAIAEFIKHEYGDIKFVDYVSFIRRSPNKKIFSHCLYLDYISKMCKQCFETEKEKMLYFLLTCNQNIVVVKSGQKQEEKAFLGYEFTKRRGHEGIKLSRKGTMLFDESDVLNPQKVNSYIYNAFLGKLPTAIDEPMAKYISCSRMSDLLEYGTSKFIKRFNLRVKPNNDLKLRNKEILVALGSVCDVISGQSPDSEFYNEDGEGLPFYQGKTEFTNKFLGTPRTWTTSVTKTAIKGDIVMSVRAPVGPVNFVENEICIGRGLAALRCDESKVIPLYIFHLLLSMQDEVSGRIGMAFDSISRDEILALKIPVPSLDIQKKIVTAFENSSAEIGTVEERIVNTQRSLESKFLQLFGDPVSNPLNWQTEKLVGVTTKIGSGATPKGGESSYTASGISLIRSMNVHNGYFKYDGLAFIADEQAKQLDGVTVQANDVLLNITGASVARTCVVPGDVLPARVNQHVSIIRCDSSRLNHIFANAALTTGSYQQLLISIGEAAGMSRQAITKVQIEDLSMILPPVEMQNDFAEFCNETHKAIAHYQKALDEALKKRDGILSQYL